MWAARQRGLCAVVCQATLGRYVTSRPSITKTQQSSTLKDGTVKEYLWHAYTCPGRTKRKYAHRCDMPILPVELVDNRAWQWVKEELATPAIFERKLREIQQEQKNEAGGLRDRLDVLSSHKEEIEGELKRIGTLYAKGMPDHLVEQLISEQSHKLQLVTEEIRKLERDQETPLTDNTIGDLVSFSREFGEHLEAIGQRFEAKCVVIDGLDVQVVAVKRNEEVWLDITSMLRPEVISVTLFPSS